MINHIIIYEMTIYLGSNSFFQIFFNKSQICDRPIVFQNLRIQTLFLNKGEMISDLQDVVKTPDEKQGFTIRRIILIIENN